LQTCGEGQTEREREREKFKFLKIRGTHELVRG